MIARLSAALAERYTVLRELGQGGMATVYLAHDLRHERDVAIKVLHPDLAAALGGDRFLSEIKTTARLQHPHILPLLDSGAADGLLYYVMPYVTGETLRSRLQRERQLGVDEALRIAREVADALGAAHALGIVHRDIKPENILLQGGHALVADFGIAIAVQSASSARMTQTGLSLGTPQYMSPEQAMGDRAIDLRADLYALGAVTYEMLTGDAPFTGSSVQAIVAKVLTEKPTPIHTTRDTVPEHVESAVMMALSKLPADRFADTRAFSEALAGRATVVQSGARPAVQRGTGSRERLAWGIAALVTLVTLVLGATLLQQRSATGSAAPLVADIVAPSNCTIIPGANGGHSQLSPDGTHLAMISRCDTTISLWVRSLVTGSEQEVAGTADASYPFWSPDSRSIGYFQAGRLKRVDLANGVVRDLAAAPNGRGGSWSRQDSIVFAPDLRGGLHIVSAGGGDAPLRIPLVTDSAATWHHRAPSLLPSGKSVLLISLQPGARASRLGIARLTGGPPRVLLEGVTAATWSQGHLFYVKGGVIFAHPFDDNAETFTGPPVTVIGGVTEALNRFLGEFTIAQTGRLALLPAAEPRSRFGWFNPRTGAFAEVLTPDRYGIAALSPDGRTLAVFRQSDRDSEARLWLRDLEDGQWLQTEVVSDQQSTVLTWSRAPQRLNVMLAQAAETAVYEADGTRLRDVRSTITRPFGAFSADGRVILGEQQVAGTGWDIVRVTVEGDSIRSEPLLVRPGDEYLARLAPSGSTFSYIALPEGRVQVASVDRPAASRVAWPSSARDHEWSSDGRTLYVVTQQSGLFAIAVNTSLALSAAMPVSGAPAGIDRALPGPDGRLLLQLSTGRAQQPLRVYDHWRAAMVTR
jgi:eukaryotic-like serine/threonine-protein kinase